MVLARLTDVLDVNETKSYGSNLRQIFQYQSIFGWILGTEGVG